MLAVYIAFVDASTKLEFLAMDMKSTAVFVLVIAMAYVSSAQTAQGAGKGTPAAPSFPPFAAVTQIPPALASPSLPAFSPLPLPPLASAAPLAGVPAAAATAAAVPRPAAATVGPAAVAAGLATHPCPLGTIDCGGLCLAGGPTSTCCGFGNFAYVCNQNENCCGTTCCPNTNKCAGTVCVLT
mmetsp:Transcript_1995/g.3739  ORF Transcript_1995/g.3739 Transcript_1995/m.3739 type:complete len:183 (-) Transcript_1995:571-1119(-)